MDRNEEENLFDAQTFNKYSSWSKIHNLLSSLTSYCIHSIEAPKSIQISKKLQKIKSDFS